MAAEEGGPTTKEKTNMVLSDYLTLFALMAPNVTSMPLTKRELCALLPLSTGVLVFWFWVFLVVELAGGAGGTSGVAGTRTVLLFILYLGMLLWSVFISRHSAAGGLNGSNAVIAFALLSIILLSATIGSALSTFGVDSCPLAEVPEGVISETRTLSLGPMAVYGPAGPSGTHVRGSCGIDSANRGAKIVFEVLFLTIFGLPMVIASFIAGVQFMWEQYIPAPQGQLGFSTNSRPTSQNLAPALLAFPASEKLVSPPMAPTREEAEPLPSTQQFVTALVPQQQHHPSSTQQQQQQQQPDRYQHQPQFATQQQAPPQPQSYQQQEQQPDRYQQQQQQEEQQAQRGPRAPEYQPGAAVSAQRIVLAQQGQQGPHQEQQGQSGQRGAPERQGHRAGGAAVRNPEVPQAVQPNRMPREYNPASSPSSRGRAVADDGDVDDIINAYLDRD